MKRIIHIPFNTKLKFFFKTHYKYVSTLNGKYSSLSNLVKVYSFVKDVTDSTCALFCTSQKLLICKEEFMFMIVELLPSSVAIGISMEEKYRIYQLRYLSRIHQNFACPCNIIIVILSHLNFFLEFAFCHLITLNRIDM
ncbi:hypothetical protein T4D_9066 [Trichinella pseudospiralis]|uniref:Uncharacterized protein n=1 Tax=Trichinella pseudospiralis TaxID=6337 RepID=A0A0V1F6H3_TRIPS|nr:hypothetical protein T4D_9066 [Trichinella pseudospiralis]